MKHRIIGLALLGAASLATTASAEDRSFNGVLCNPIDSTNAGRISYSAFGVHNTSASTATVNCSGAMINAVDIDFMQVVVYDRNAASNVSCTLRLQGLDGSQTAVSTVNSSGSGAAAQTLTWAPPNGFYGMFHITCSLPAASAGNFSHLASYLVRVP
jgi:hypothetical protein